MRHVVGRTLPLALLQVATLACWGAGTPSAANMNPAEEIAVPNPDPGERVLKGRLKKTVEKGGWLLKTETRTYLLLAVEGFRDASWFKEGARVRAIGREAPDAVTVFMQGAPFRVRVLEPIASAPEPPGSQDLRRDFHRPREGVR